MAILPVDYTWGTVLAGFRLPINWARNGIIPPGGDARGLCDYYNYLLAGRKKVLFRKSIRPPACATSTGDLTTWRWACHTGPVTTTLHVTYVVVPTLGSDSNSTPSAYLVSTTGLTGAGTATTYDPIYVDDSKSTTIVPNDYRAQERDITVLADQDYRFELHVTNGMRVIGLTVEELPRLVLDTSTDTAAVDSSAVQQGYSVWDAPTADLFAAADKVWTRNGKTLFSWSVAGITPIQRTSATKANLIDQAQLGWAANTPGHPVNTLYCGSLDEATIPAVFYAYGSMAAGTGKVTIVGASGPIAVINVTSPSAQFWTKTANLTQTDDKLDVFFEGDGTNAHSLYQVGAFLGS